MWRKIRSIVGHSQGGRDARMLFVRDPELLGIAQIANRRRLGMEQSLDRVFEKVEPILNRQSATQSPVRESELPAALLEKVAAMPDAEQKIRAIVEFKLSARKRADDGKENA